MRHEKGGHPRVGRHLFAEVDRVTDREPATSAQLEGDEGRGQGPPRIVICHGDDELPVRVPIRGGRMRMGQADSEARDRVGLRESSVDRSEHGRFRIVRRNSRELRFRAGDPLVVTDETIRLILRAFVLHQTFHQGSGRGSDSSAPR
jgi:hypothetical protein